MFCGEERAAAAARGFQQVIKQILYMPKTNFLYAKHYNQAVRSTETLERSDPLRSSAFRRSGKDIPLRKAEFLFNNFFKRMFYDLPKPPLRFL